MRVLLGLDLFHGGVCLGAIHPWYQSYGSRVKEAQADVVMILRDVAAVRSQEVVDAGQDHPGPRKLVRASVESLFHCLHFFFPPRN